MDIQTLTKTKPVFLIQKTGLSYLHSVNACLKPSTTFV